MEQDKVSRRDFLKSCILGSATVLLSSCSTGAMYTHVPHPSPQAGNGTSPNSILMPPGSKSIIHEVKPSETIAYIAKRYNVSIDALCKANGLKPGAMLQPGQKMLIPGSLKSMASLAPAPTEFQLPPPLRPVTSPQTFVTPIKMPVAGPSVHEVAPLETVWRISKMYDVSVESVYQANGLRPGSPIHVGQRLVIPDAKVFYNVIPLYPNQRWQYIVVHHTATEIGNASLIDRSHYSRGFLQGLGYHFLIDNGTLGKGDGQIEASPRWIRQQEGAHCKAGGMNSKGIGIALVGNFNGELPTPNQLQSLIYLTRTLDQSYSIRPSHIIQHREVSGAKTDCPGHRFPWSTFQTYVYRS